MTSVTRTRRGYGDGCRLNSEGQQGGRKAEGR